MGIKYSARYLSKPFEYFVKLIPYYGTKNWKNAETIFPDVMKTQLKEFILGHFFVALIFDATVEDSRAPRVSL